MAPQESPKKSETHDEGVVKAPVEAGGDKLPEGAIFSDVSSAPAKPQTPASPAIGPPVNSTPLSASKPPETPKAATTSTPVKPTEASRATAPLPAPVAPKRNRPATTTASKPTVAIPIAVVCFVVLVGVAILAYTSSQ